MTLGLVVCLNESLWFAYVDSSETFANFPLKAFLSQSIKSFVFPTNYLVYLQSLLLRKINSFNFKQSKSNKITKYMSPLIVWHENIKEL